MTTDTRAEQLIADTFSEAYLAGVDMHQAADQLIALQRSMARAHSIQDCRNVIDTEIANLDPEEPLSRITIALREHVTNLQLVELRDRIDATAGENPAGARDLWVSSLADFACQLWTHPLGEVAQWASSRNFLEADFAIAATQASRMIAAARYFDALAFFEMLAGQPAVTPDLAMELRCLIGQVVLHRADDLVGTTRLIDNVTSEYGTQARVLMLQADCACKRAEWAEDLSGSSELLDEADRLLDAAAEMAPDDRCLAAIERERGDLEWQRATLKPGVAPEKEHVDTAATHYRAALALEPHNAYCYVRLATCAVRTGASLDQPDVARQLAIARALASDGSVEIELAIGSALFDADKVPAARECAERAVSMAPGHVDAVTLLNGALLSMGDLGQARSVLEAAERVLPGSFDVARQSAWLAESEKRYDEAVQHHQAALKIRPSARAAVESDLAWVYTQLDDLTRAETHAVSACRALLDDGDREGPVVGPATNRLLTIANRIAPTRIDDALAHLDLIRAVKGETFEAAYWNRRGILLQSVGRDLEAASQYRTAATLAASNAVYWRNLGWTLVRLDRLDEAHQAMETAQSLVADTAEHEEFLAWIANSRGLDAYEAGRSEEAEKGFRDAVKLEPSNATYRGNLATALEERLVNAARPRRPLLVEAVDALEKIETLTDTTEKRIGHLRRKLSALDMFGEFVLEVGPFSPLTVMLSDDVVPLFVGDDGNLRPEVAEKLDGASPEICFGIRRPGVRLKTNSALAPSTAVLAVNGALERSLLVQEADDVISAVDDFVREHPAELIGPDQTVALVESLQLTADSRSWEPSLLVALTHLVRNHASKGVGVDELRRDFAALLVSSGASPEQAVGAP